jgi:ribose-phosphate pyrophosphokinase
MKPLALPLPGNDALAAGLGMEVGLLECRRFPDGEAYVRVRSDVTGRAVVLACTLNSPDMKFLSLVYAAKAARELGAKSVGLVAPYLAYMRQDKRFHPGEALTSAQFAALLSASFDWLVTADPHLHRRSSLAEIYSIPARVVQCAPLLAGWIRQNVPDAWVVGPDEESGQWAASVAAGAPYAVMKKKRRGDRNVEIEIPDLSAGRGRTPVLVDDIISSGRTMAVACSKLRDAGFAAPVCLGIHAVFAGDANEALVAAGAGRIVTVNTIRHPTNGMDADRLLAEAARACLVEGR